MDEDQTDKEFCAWIAEREATPAYRRAQPHYGQSMLAHMQAHSGEGDAPNMDSLFDATAAAIRTCNAVANAGHDAEDPINAEKAAELAFRMLQSIVKLHPEAAELAHDAAEMMTLAWASISSRLINAQIEREIPAIRPIARINASKAAVIKRAQAIATELWQADTAQEIRLGDMAERVYRALAADGFTESLPGTAERIKEWIKPAAPDYARKPGRRRKTP